MLATCNVWACCSEWERVLLKGEAPGLPEAARETREKGMAGEIARTHGEGAGLVAGLVAGPGAGRGANRAGRWVLVLALGAGLALSGCSRVGGLFGGKSRADGTTASAPAEAGQAGAPRIDPRTAREKVEEGEGGKFWDLFRGGDNPNTTVKVNRYLWQASIDTLGFLPIEAADPFTGVIVFGWGRPKGGGRAYRATVHIEDAALDARALKVSVMTRSGPADPDTVRAIEDAILSRARQLRIRDKKL